MIEYEDKEAINVDPTILAKNKWRDSDANEVKNAFNTQVATGWYKLQNTTFAFSSWNNTSKIGVITTSEDLTSLLDVGTILKFTNSTVKYGRIIAITSSTITLYMGDETLLNSSISLVYYSIVKNPSGCPRKIKTNMITLWSGSQTSTGSIELYNDYTNYDMLIFTLCPGDTGNINNAILMTEGISTGASHFLTAFQDTNAYINFNISFVDNTHINITNIFKSTNWSSLTAFMTKIVGVRF